MRVYLAIMGMAFRRQRAYRAANLSGLATNAFFGVVRSSVFVALYAARPRARGYDLGDALGYVWASQALIMPLYLWGWFEVAQAVRSGDIVGDLCKPVDYYAYWLSRDVAGPPTTLPTAGCPRWRSACCSSARGCPAAPRPGRSSP